MPPRRRHRGQGGACRPDPGSARRVRRRRPAQRPRRLPGSSIDGRNVQRALERGSAPGSLPTSSLIALLRAAFPGTELELVLDGHARGSPTGKVAPGFSVAYSRARHRGPRHRRPGRRSAARARAGGRLVGDGRLGRSRGPRPRPQQRRPRRGHGVARGSHGRAPAAGRGHRPRAGRRGRRRPARVD